MRKALGPVFVLSLYVIALAAVIFAGLTKPVVPASQASVGQPAVIMQVLDPSLEQYATLWQSEIGRRFDNAVAILVHGGDFVEGQWIVEGNYASGQHVQLAADVVRHYQELYPGRTIILLACNPGHLKLGIPGVYYAKSSVWCVPDRSLTPDMLASGSDRATLSDGEADDPDDVPSQSNAGPQPSRWQSDPDDVGNIYEFVSE